MSTTAIDPSLLPQTNQRLGANPLLPTHPATESMDSQYIAEEAILRANIAKQYADILQQLGWTNDQGQFIPGQVSVNANRQEGELQRSSDLATQDVTETAQRQGTLFSGRRAVDTARAEYPFQQQIAQLGIDVPMALGQLTEQASGLIDQYTLQNNLLLSQAAARAAQLAALGSSGGGVSSGGGTQSPPLSTNLNPGGNPITNDGGPGTGLSGTSPGTIAGAPDYPGLGSQPNSEGDTSPNIFTPVTVGDTTSAEPKPSAGNIDPDVAAAARDRAGRSMPGQGGNARSRGDLPGGQPVGVSTPVTVGGETSMEPKNPMAAQPLPQPDPGPPANDMGDVGGTISLTPEQIAAIAAAVPPQLSQGQLNTPPTAQPNPIPIDLTPAQQQDVQNNDFPQLTDDQLNNVPSNIPGVTDQEIQQIPNSNIAAGQAANNAPPTIVRNRGRAL